MKTAIGAGGADSGQQRNFHKTVDFVVEAEKLGVDQAWTAEAWGLDAVSTAGFLAARTERIEIGSGIMQIAARTPSMTAMSALSLAALSGDRFLLGLGASGPQVVEGLQGQAFHKPLTRMREVIEIVRMACRGEKLVYDGEHYVLPRPGGEGKALRLAQPPNSKLPIWLATLSPRGLELTGELADGWLGACFTPECPEAHLEHLDRGLAKAGRTRRELTLSAGGAIAFVDDPEPLIQRAKPGMAFMLGAMGSPTTNFYNNAYRRGGFEEVAIRVQRLWIEGKRDEAIHAVPDEMIREVSLIGDEAHVRAQLRKYIAVGIDVFRIDPHGANATERLDTLGRAVELIQQETA